MKANFFVNSFENLNYLVNDCGDESDELACHHNITVTCANQTNHCDQRCHDLPNGRGIVCSCDVGYKYNKESFKCEDIDECGNSTLNYCSQICVNTKGGFRCECASGFQPSEVNRSDCHPGGNVFDYTKIMNMKTTCKTGKRDCSTEVSLFFS